MLHAVRHELVRRIFLGVALNLRADQLIRSVRNRMRVSRHAERFAVPAIFWAIADRQPSRPVTSDRIGFLHRFKSRRWPLALLRVVTLEQFAVAHHAASPVNLPRGDALAYDDP